MISKNTFLVTGLFAVLCCFQTNAQTPVSAPSIQQGYIKEALTNAGLSNVYDMPNGNFLYSGNGIVVDGTGTMVNQYDLTDNTVLGFTGTTSQSSRHLRPLSDGSFILKATASSAIVITATNQTLTPHGGNDILIVKYDSSFNLQWAKLYGGSAKDGANDIIQTADGGYILVGNTQSTDGDLQGIKTAADTINHVYIAKLDATGTIQWQKTYGGTQAAATINGRYIGQEVIQTSDNNYLVSATLNGTADGDITETPLGGSDVWMLKLNGTDGTILWQKLLGGSNTDSGKKIRELADGHFTVLVKSKSVDGQVTYPKGGFDAWLVKLDKANGNILWDVSIGGNSDEEESGSMDFALAPEGNIVVATPTLSTELPGFQGTSTIGNILVSKINYLNGEIIWDRLFGPTGPNYNNHAPNNFTMSRSMAIHSLSNGNLFIFGHISREVPIADANNQIEAVLPFSGPDMDNSFTQHNYTDNDDIADWYFKLAPDALDTNKWDTSKFGYYPNPANDMVYFTESVQAVQVYDLSGRQLLNQKSEAITEINVSALQQGTYIVTVTKEGTPHSFKIIKK